MKTWTTRLLILVSLLCIGDAVSHRVAAQDEPLTVREPKSRLQAFMRKKLVASEHIMEGLTVPDYRLIRKGATSMIHMSKEAMWEIHGTPAYAQDSADFVRSAERLIKLSDAKDLEGASHTYAQLTIQCVNCHRRVRTQKVAIANDVSDNLTLTDLDKRVPAWKLLQDTARLD